MRLNRSLIVALAALLTIGAFSSLAMASRSSGVSRTAVPRSSIIFTYNGRAVGKPMLAPLHANDFEVYWGQQGCSGNFEFPPIIVEWTYHGQLIAGDPPLAPCRANDVEIVWRPMKPASGPEDGIARAIWTINGKRLAPIRLPKGNLIRGLANGPVKNPFVDDACFELSYADGGMSMVAWTDNGRTIGKGVPIPVVAGTSLRANDVCWYGYKPK